MTAAVPSCLVYALATLVFHVYSIIGLPANSQKNVSIPHNHTVSNKVTAHPLDWVNHHHRWLCSGFVRLQGLVIAFSQVSSSVSVAQ